MDRMSVGFVGLGLMGSGMARNIRAAGYPLTVRNRTAAKAQPLIDAGAQAGDSPAGVAAKAEIVFTCLTDTAAMREAVFGEGGIAQGARQDVEEQRVDIH